MHIPRMSEWNSPTGCLYLPDLLYPCIPGVVAARVWVVSTQQHQELIFSSRKRILWSHLRRGNHCSVTDLSFFEVPTQEIFVTEKFVVMDVIQCKIGLDFFDRWFLQIKSSLLFDGLGYTPHALHSSPRGKKGTKRVTRKRFSIEQQLLAMSKYLIFTTLLMKLDTKVWRTSSFDGFLPHWCILFTQTSSEDCVLQPSSTHCIIPPHRRWWDDEGSTTYLAESSGGRLASPPPIHQSIWRISQNEIRRRVFLGYIPGGLLRSSKNHQQYQAASSFF